MQQYKLFTINNHHIDVYFWMIYNEYNAVVNAAGVWLCSAAAGWVCSERVHPAGPESGGAGQTLLRPAAVARSRLLMQPAGAARWIYLLAGLDLKD